MTDAARWQSVIDGTWPAERRVERDGWTLRIAPGAGGRVNALSGTGEVGAGIALARAHGSRPSFIVWPGAEALDGIAVKDPTFGMDAMWIDTHRADDALDQRWIIEQHRAAAASVHRPGRTAEIQVDTGRAQRCRPPGVRRQRFRLATEQLHEHWNAAGRTPPVLQLRAQPEEHLLGQQPIADAHEFGDAARVATAIGQLGTHVRIQRALHRRQHDPARRLADGGHGPRVAGMRAARLVRGRAAPHTARHAHR